MDFDIILRQARLSTSPDGTLVDIAISNGRIEACGPSLEGEGPEEHVYGRLVVPGFVETHIHLDKSCLLGRCKCHKGTLDEAVAAVATAKREFTEEDVYLRAEKTLCKAISHGTTRMRTHVEVDPRIGLTSLKALNRLKKDYAWAIDLQFCAFPQEGLLDDPGCDEVLVSALKNGATVVGGAPYMDKDSHGQIARIFELAREFDIDIDFHLDFGLDTSRLDADEVCRLTDRNGWGGRVTIGHVTKFSALGTEKFEALSTKLATSGVAVTVLPATELYLIGRDYDHNVPRGVTPVHRMLERGVNCSLSSNNVLNPFTPFGDCNLIRMSNMYANVAQVGTPDGLASCLDLVTRHSAKLLNLHDYGFAVGNPADFVVLDAYAPSDAISEIAVPIFGYKSGHKTFNRPTATLNRPHQ